MKLIVLNSNSSGNCYLLKGKHETLILEAGVKYKEILKALDFDLSSVAGAVVSHEHKDHSLSVPDLLKNGISVFANNPTLELETSHNAYRLIKGVGVIIGGFKVLSFEVFHDVPCFGYLISHKEMGNLVFITDTMMCEYTFPGMNHILVECNYSDEILEENIQSGKVHPSMRERLLQTHMELSTTKSLLLANDNDKLKSIVLIHLSSQNSDPQFFKQEIQKAIGKPVHIAQPNLQVEL